jgi:hypothetical protein
MKSQFQLDFTENFFTREVVAIFVRIKEYYVLCKKPFVEQLLTLCLIVLVMVGEKVVVIYLDPIACVQFFYHA